MAELTIAQLTELLAANVDNADLLPIWDDTAAETKKITISQFRTAVGVSNWAESFSSATQATSRWIPSNAAANVNAAIVPKGTGAITAAIPDGTTAGGNARGIGALDLQLAGRDNANQVAAATYSAILSGEKNQINSNNIYSFIGGGFRNACIGVTSTNAIVGGFGNQVLNDNNEGSCFIGGGGDNRIRSGYSVITGGRFNNTNTAPQYYQFIGGGNNNTTSSQNAAIAAGASNSASGSYSFIGGGQSNTASQSRAVVSGGQTNTASATHSSILGGQSNTASGTAGAIGGGTNNLSQVYKGFVGGGATNTANAFGSVGGGFTNVANSNVALGTVNVTLTAGSAFVPAGFIGGNQSPTGCLITGAGVPDNTFLLSTGPPNITMTNNATASGATTLTYWNVGGTVGGGRSNTATGLYATVSGGQNNTASSNHTFVGGGSGNSVSGTFTDSYSLIVGGFGNGVSGNYDVLVGGRSNGISGTNNGNHRFIGGGSSNFIGEQSLYSIIVGGETNSIVGRNAFIGGGNAITMTGGNGYSVIGGGQSNTMSGGNTHMVIGGGFSNTASAGSSVVSGGSTNTASGVVSIITGGLQGVASLYGQQVHASGRFTANGDAQAHELIWRRLVAGAPVGGSELFLDGASVAAILPATNSVWHGIIDCVAICTATGDGTTVVNAVEATSYKVTIKRIGTATSLVGTVQEIGTTNADASMASGIFTIDNNDTNESLRIVFTSPTTAGSTTNIRCVATFRGTQIQY